MGYCKDCRIPIYSDYNMVMIHNDLWYSICDDPLDLLCDKCIEKRLKRNIMENDLKLYNGNKMIPCNLFWLNNKKLII